MCLCVLWMYCFHPKNFIRCIRNKIMEHILLEILLLCSPYTVNCSNIYCKRQVWQKRQTVFLPLIGFVLLTVKRTKLGIFSSANWGLSKKSFRRPSETTWDDVGANQVTAHPGRPLINEKPEEGIRATTKNRLWLWSLSQGCFQILTEVKSC